MNEATKDGTDAPELKPCPFCGGEADLMVSECDDGTLAVVMCMSCYSLGQETLSDNEATTAWNNRTLARKARRIPSAITTQPATETITVDDIIEDALGHMYTEEQVAAIREAARRTAIKEAEQVYINYGVDFNAGIADIILALSDMKASEIVLLADHLTVVQSARNAALRDAAGALADSGEHQALHVIETLMTKETGDE